MENIKIKIKSSQNIKKASTAIGSDQGGKIIYIHTHGQNWNLSHLF